MFVIEGFTITLNYVLQNKTEWAALLKEGVSSVFNQGKALTKAGEDKIVGAALALAANPVAQAAFVVLQQVVSGTRARHVAQNQDDTASDNFLEDDEREKMKMEEDDTADEEAKAESLEERIYNELSRIQEEVMEEYYKAPKCGEEQWEKSWEEELIKLLEQIKNGFVVRKQSF